MLPAGHQAEKNGRGTNTSHMRPKKRQIQANRDGGAGGALKSSGKIQITGFTPKGVSD